MTAFLDRYYALILVLALPAPLWLGVVQSPAALRLSALSDAIVWCAILLAGWLVVRKLPRYQVRGAWRSPTKQESSRYLKFLLAILIIDYGSKALFFRWDRPERVEIFQNFGLYSIFHVTAFESFHVYLLLYFAYLFLLGPWYFRFTNPVHDRIWVASGATALGGAIALVSERWLFGGVHDSFYFAGALLNYVWTPADFFVHAAILPLIVLIASYAEPARQ
jgi:lipoprotein signal peptidase